MEIFSVYYNSRRHRGGSWSTFLIILVCLLSKLSVSQGAIFQGPTTTIAHPGDDVELMCNISTNGGIVVWMVNGQTFLESQLHNGMPPGHNISGTNILILDLTLGDSRNGSEYICVLVQSPPPNIDSNPAFLYVADVPAMVPAVSIDTDTITIDENGVNLTVRWGEPFNNFDPITSYIVSCTSDVGCPPPFTIPDNTTMNYTFTGLMSMVNYTFSVEATNSLGSGLAGVIMITALSVPSQVMGVMLMCGPVEMDNKCTAEWEAVVDTGGPLSEPLWYQVYYNGTTENVTSPTTMLMFTAPKLPGMFTGDIIVVVTAINRFGSALPSDPATDSINGPSVTDAEAVLDTLNINSNIHNITVTCTIDPESTAEQCEVMAIPTTSGATLTGTADITNGTNMATVTIKNLLCEIEYTITSGGLTNRNLVGPRSSHGTVMSGTCPVVLMPTTTTLTTATTATIAVPPTTTPTTGGSSDENTGAIIGLIVGGTCGVIVVVVVIIIVIYCFCCRKDNKKSYSVPMHIVPPTYENLQPSSSDKVQMDTNSTYTVPTTATIKMDDNPAYQTMTTNLGGGGGAGSGVNCYEDIIVDRKVKMTQNPAYAVP